MKILVSHSRLHQQRESPLRPILSGHHMEPSSSNTNPPPQSPEQVGSDAPTLPARPPATTDELASLLDAGMIQEFNARRPNGAIFFKGLSFSRSDMANANLSSVVFTRCTLRQCQMTNAVMRGACFEECDLQGCHLTGIEASYFSMSRCFMRDVSFRNAMLHVSHFKSCSIQNGMFDHASLQSARLVCCELDQCSFDKVRGSQLKVENCRIVGSHFKGSDLGQAHFFQNHGEGVSFDKSNLCDAGFNGSWWHVRFSVDGAYMKSGTLQEFMFAPRVWDDGQMLKTVKMCDAPPAGTFDGLRRGKEVVKPLVDGIPGTDRALYESSLRKLSNLIGLEDVKREVEQLAALLRVTRHRQLLGADVDFGTMHYVFSGPPGTGKTTVARIFGELLLSLGYLSKGHFVETDRSGIVGRYLGETGLKTKAVVEEAAGGVLFIDEAYTLASGNEKDQYGEEAIATLLKLMEDRRRDLVVIAAGYDKEMDAFLRSNPGLQSRFANSLRFAALSSSALTDVAKSFISSSGFVADEVTMKGLSRLIDILKEREGARFGNARAIRNIYDKMIRRQAVRLTQGEGMLDQSEVNTLTFDDLPCQELAQVSHEYLIALVEKEPLSVFDQGLEALIKLKLGVRR